MPRRTMFCVSIAAMALVAGAASAADEGFFVFEQETTQTTTLASGVVVNVIVQRGFNIANDSDHRLHLANQNCYGTLVADTETTFIGSGYCTLGARTGDGGIFLSWEGNQDGGTFKVTRGGGSLAGTTGSGTYTLADSGQYADGKGFIPVSATYDFP